jgi:hypothetical protein
MVVVERIAKHFEGEGYSTSGTAVMGGVLPYSVDLAELSGKRVYAVDKKITERWAQNHQHWFDATGTSVSVIAGSTTIALNAYRYDQKIPTIAPVRFIWPISGHPGHEDYRRPKAKVLNPPPTDPAWLDLGFTPCLMVPGTGYGAQQRRFEPWGQRLGAEHGSRGTGSLEYDQEGDEPWGVWYLRTVSWKAVTLGDELAFKVAKSWGRYNRKVWGKDGIRRALPCVYAQEGYSLPNPRGWNEWARVQRLRLPGSGYADVERLQEHLEQFEREQREPKWFGRGGLIGIDLPRLPDKDDDVDGCKIGFALGEGPTTIEIFPDGSFAVHRRGERRNHARMRNSFPAVSWSRANGGIVGYRQPQWSEPARYLLSEGKTFDLWTADSKAYRAPLNRHEIKRRNTWVPVVPRLPPKCTARIKTTRLTTTIARLQPMRRLMQERLDGVDDLDRLAVSAAIEAAY